MKKFIYDLEKKIKDRLIVYLAILFILAIIGIIF
jgi:hypothetical protein